MSLHPVVVAAMLLPVLAVAADLPGRAAFVESGWAQHGTDSLTAGVSWDGNWRRRFGRTEVTGRLELLASRWSYADTSGSPAHATLVALVPMARLRYDYGRSPWFLEAGVGLALANRRYGTPQKAFSTAANFYDTVAVGRSLGEGWRHELSLRVTHLSNGGIRKPNPGENFVQLRYTLRF